MSSEPTQGIQIKKYVLFTLFVLVILLLVVNKNDGGDAEPGKKRLVFLSWNLPGYEKNFRRMIREFEQSHPGFEIELIDKKGSEWATFYQTQVIAGTQPDIVDIQGLLWVEYAEQDLLLDLKPMLDAEPEVRERFSEDALALWEKDGRQFMLPLYFTKSLLIYNKRMFNEAGIANPPANFDELLDYTARLSGDGRTGFISLNMDWMYWALFAMNDIALLTPDLKKAAFNTPVMLDVLTRLAEATRAGHIDKLSWTGQWKEPNSAFAAGNIGMHQASTSAVFWTAAEADWMTPDTIGIASLPAGLGVPSAHGYGIARDTKYPGAAWEFIKLATSDKWQKVFGDSFTVLTLNKNVDKAMLQRVSVEEPLKEAALRVSLSHFDKLVATWRTPMDARIKDAFYPPIQAALLGEKEPETAIAEAERAVNRVLRRVRLYE